MAYIIVFDQDRGCKLRIGNVLDWRCFQFKIIDKKLNIQYESNTHILENGMSIQIKDEYKIIYLYDSNQWFLYKIEHFPFYIGRFTINDFRIEDSIVSSKHAVIDVNSDALYIRDLDSTNGVFLNNKKIKHSILKSGDEIIIGSALFYIFNDYFISNVYADTNVSNILFEKKDNLFSPIDIRDEIDLSWHIQNLDLQIPQLSEVQNKNNWIHIFGSSILMMCSPMISTVVLWLTGMHEIKHLVMNVISNVTMSICFLIYNFLNNKFMHNQEFKEHEFKRELYLKYLSKKEFEYISLKNEINQKNNMEFEFGFDMTSKSFGLWNKSKKMILISKVEKEWAIISNQEIPYQYEQDKLYKKRNELISKLSIPVSVPRYIYENTVVWLKMKFDMDIVFHLFFHWCWKKHADIYKWIWYCPNIEINESLLDLKCCQEGTHRLIAKNRKQFDELMHLLNFDHKYILFMTSYIDVNWKQTCIYMNDKDELLNYDFLYEKKDLCFPKMDFKNIYNIKRCQEWYLYNTENHPSILDIIAEIKIKKYANLSVPAGISTKNEIIKLDFSEKNHGPHALIAGMTGSGKSQWIMNILLFLSLQNTPEQMQFLLIDFKGGAFGQHFYLYPHCAGYLTNLDFQEVDRFKKSIEVEVERRQILLKEFISKCSNGVADIESYNMLSGREMSHVFIVVDEFAQLKKLYPDFLDTLKEIARIGRSLGFHLILSTQKPLGVIDDQIWSNSKLKVCFKVNSEGDSHEILHHNKAASLTKIGSFIAQVGNQEEEFSGVGFWLHQSMNKEKYWKEVDERDREIACSPRVNKKTYFEHYSNFILNKKVTYKKYIVLPSLDKMVNNNHFLWIDDFYSQTQKGLDFEKNEKIIVFVEDEEKKEIFIRSLLSFYKMKKIGFYGNPKWKKYIDFYIEHPNLKQNLEIDVLILENITELLYMHCVCFTIITSYKTLQRTNLYAFDYRICLSCENIEAISLFFENYKLKSLPFAENTGWIAYNNNLIKCAFFLDDALTVKKADIKREWFIIGKQEDKNTYVTWSKKDMLLICYVQKSIEKDIYLLLKKWKEKDPTLKIDTNFDKDSNIYIVNLLENTDFNTNRKFLDNQYDFNILWVGAGLSDYGYLIKKIVVENKASDCILWKRDEVFYVDKFIDTFENIC